MNFKDRWVRHSVAIDKLTRTIHRIAKAGDWTKQNKKSVTRTYDEMVHIHDVYREKLPSGKVSPILWHRGAKVGMV